jgi:hypothetical protein
MLKLLNAQIKLIRIREAPENNFTLHKCMEKWGGRKELQFEILKIRQLKKIKNKCQLLSTI